MSLFMYSPQPAKEHAPITFRWRWITVTECQRCHGYGWCTTDGYDEMYCESKCEAEKWRRIYDGGHPDEDP